MRRRPCVQKQDGTPSIGLTNREFAVLAGRLVAEAEAGLAADPAAFPLGYPIVSLDNAKPHAAWQRGQPAERLNIIPARSPDIHKVVEHPLKEFNRKWYVRFSQDLKCTTCERSMALASEILHETTADSIHRDIKTLPDTLRSIIANRGDWADDVLC